MIRLIRNELFKLFHKKGFFILLIIALTCGILGFVLDKYYEGNAFLTDSALSGKKLAVENTEKGIEIDQFYPENKALVEMYKYLDEHPDWKDQYSPEYYYLSNTYFFTVQNYYQNKFQGADEESLNQYKKELDEQTEFVNHFDWRKIIENEINKQKEYKEFCEANDTNCIAECDETIKVLQYRLDNNIPYSRKDASTVLDEYLDNYNQYLSMEKDESKISKHSTLYEKRSAEEALAKTKYMMDNKLLTNDYVLYDTRSDLKACFKTLNIFVVLCILLLSGTAIADEFNKGTIKQLLVRPYNRYKIITSKMISVLIASLVFLLIITALDVFITGLETHTFGNLLLPDIVYNFNTGKVMEVNIFVEALHMLALTLPQMILMELITIAVSVLFTNNAVSIIIGLLAYVSPVVLEGVATRAPILSYIPTLNWNFNSYIHGAIQFSQYLVLSKSIYITVSSVVLLLLISLIVFNHKDIKNQ